MNAWIFVILISTLMITSHSSVNNMNHMHYLPFSQASHPISCLLCEDNYTDLSCQVLTIITKNVLLYALCKCLVLLRQEVAEAFLTSSKEIVIELRIEPGILFLTALTAMLQLFSRQIPLKNVHATFRCKRSLIHRNCKGNSSY